MIEPAYQHRVLRRGIAVLLALLLPAASPVTARPAPTGPD